jgi:hypothetical protein
MEKLKEINKILQDHERRISALEGKKKIVYKKDSWYKPGSTVDKLVKFISEDFFDKPKSLKEIVFKFEEKDFHLKDSDLTLPLRKVVRKGLLNKTKQLPGGMVSKKWLYVKL